MIHAIHIIGSRQLGGAEHFYLRLVQALSAGGHTVLSVNRPKSPVSRELDRRQPQTHIPMANGFDIWSAFRIRRLIRKIRPQVVQTYMGRATRLTRLPRDINTIHVARLGGYYKVKGYYEHADAWVANTQGLCDYLLGQGLAAERVYLIGNFVDPKPSADENELDGLRKALQIPPDALIIFSLGRFIEIKGFDDLLDAIARLPQQIKEKPVYMVIAGDGPLKKRLNTHARQCRIESRLRWVGWQNNPSPYFHLADIFICPSLKETLGNVILEAWAHRLPVVATRTPGGKALIQDGHNGRLADVAAPSDLAGRIGEVLAAEPQERKRLAENGFHTLQQNHSSRAVVKAYLEMYENVWRQKYGISTPQREIKA